MKRFLTALLIFLISLGLLSLLNNEGNNSSHYSAESVSSPFIENPVLEEKIDKATITHYVQDGIKDDVKLVRFVTLLSNIDELPISAIEFEVMDQTTGQLFYETVTEIYSKIEVENQLVTAESMGGDYWAFIIFQNPQYGNYNVTCSISYHESKTKTIASRIYCISEKGTT